MFTAQSGNCCTNQLLVEAAPSTPYSFTTQFIQNGFAGSGSSGTNGGLAIRDSGTGKFSACEMWDNASNLPVIRLEHWNSPTSDSGTVAALTFQAMGPVGVKYLDNGTNQSCYYTLDGQNWILLATESRTAFMANPDQVGFVQLQWNGPNPGDWLTFFDFTQGIS